MWRRVTTREVGKVGTFKNSGVIGLVREDNVGSRGAQRDRAKGGCWVGGWALVQEARWVKNRRGDAEWDGGEGGLKTCKKGW